MIKEVYSVCSACVKYDMTCTDNDHCWTICPELNQCCCAETCHHVRAVIDEFSGETCMPCDVILDSGADTSVLPLCFGDLGEACADPSSTYVDAQGCPLAVESTRVATLQFGDIAFKEKFIVADVMTPLVALGHIIRAGWNLVQGENGPCLVKGSKCIQVHYRHNSLCARGSISMVSQVDPQDALPAIRAVQLGFVLRTLPSGWQRLNPQLFAIKTKQPKFVDTTLAPADEVMWLRTTLVCREGGSWEVLEFCEAIGELPGGIDDDIIAPESVLEVLTLAHKYAMPAENLGFFMPDYGLDMSQSHEPAIDHEVADGDRSSGYEQSIAADPPEEAPVAEQDGEVLEEDRIVPRTEDEAVVYIDGVALTVDSPLRALRAGCESFGLSKRGSKQMCMKRMLDHVQTQTLLAAHGAEVRLKSEAEREVRGQGVPKPPTDEEVQTHNLTHEPYQQWCELCVMHRGRQDPHVKSLHEHSGHSVLSYDFLFCSRMAGEDDKQTCLVLHDRDTQLIHVIPTLQKGGKSLQYLVTEFVRFIMHTQHKELALRSDLEPANLALADSVRKTCRGLGITVHHEPIAKGEHQSNGAVESTLQQVRLKAGILITQIEKAVGGSQIIFPCTHPLYCWALLHAAWLSNRYSVKQGTTEFERSADRMYTGNFVCLVKAFWATSSQIAREPLAGAKESGLAKH